jgi:hypothetical protein
MRRLIIAVVVLAVGYALAGRALHVFTTATQTLACANAKRSVQEAAVAYYADHGGWAADINSLLADRLLRELPSGTGYTVTYHGDGTVTATGACH